MSTTRAAMERWTANTVEGPRRYRYPDQQRRRRRGSARYQSIGRRRLARGLRAQLLLGGAAFATVRGRDGKTWRRIDYQYQLDLWARGRRTDQLQRLEGRDDLVYQGARARTREKSVRVNSIAPGSIIYPGGGWEGLFKQIPEFEKDFIAHEFPAGRLGRPDEVAYAVVMLASPRASWITGATIPVDGAQGRSNT